MLQYITNNQCTTSVPDQVKAVIEGGCRWIQVSTDGVSDDEIRKIVEAILPLCIEKQAFLLIESRVDLAKELNMGGVFLKENDMPCSKARMELGPAAVIGVGVNSMADVLKVSALDIDYYTLLPFRSENESVKPSLGIEGVKEIISEMAKQEVNIPHVAAGGIKFEDVKPLVNAGVNGIAVGKAIAFSSDITKETERFIKALPEPESAD